MGTSETTPSAAAAGSAFGGLVGVGITALVNADTETALSITVPCGIVGAFIFGRLFG